MMILYPDIEIQGGRSVSLPRGRKEEPLVFAISPLQAAEDFENAGADWLHVIDIDGVFQGGRHNAELILEIIQNADIPIQVGGGIRTERDVEWWLERGVKRVVLGTAAIKDLNLLKRVCYQHPESIVVSIDVRGGYVLVDGWQTQTSFQPIDLCNSFETWALPPSFIPISTALRIIQRAASLAPPRWALHLVYRSSPRA